MIDTKVQDLAKEKMIEKASQQYFRLFVQDWAEKKGLTSDSYEELVAMMIDSYMFIDEHLKEKAFEALFQDAGNGRTILETVE